MGGNSTTSYAISTRIPTHAKAELEAGEHNKGGHRVKALEFVHKAIEQTRKGIEAGERGR